MSSDTDVLDEAEFSNYESGEIYLFQWLSALEKDLKGTTVDALKGRQAQLEQLLTKIILAPEPYPQPGRAIRRAVSRSLIILYSRGETRTLFDTLQAFMKVVGDPKASASDVYRIAAFSCVGELMAVFGSQFMSFMAEIVAVSTRTLKNANSPLLRYHTLSTLQKALSTAKKAVPDVAFRDLLKLMKSSLLDKSLAVQRAATSVLLAMHDGPESGLSLSDIESIVAQCCKSLDVSDQATRLSHAALVGTLLAYTQRESIAPAPDPTPSKGKKDDGADETEGTAQTAAEKLQTMLTPQNMLALLSVQFNKASSSHKTRIGIFDFYAAVFNNLGTVFVEGNYAIIVSHFMTDLVANPRNNSSRYDTLLMRFLMGILLRDLIGVRLLSEQGQIGAIQELSNSYLKRWPAMMPGQSSPHPSVLVVVLREVAGLLQQLGNAPPPVQNAVAEPLVTILAHSSHSTRVATSWALRCFCFSTPLKLPKTLLLVIELLQRDLTTLLNPTAPLDIASRTLGHAYGLAALVSVIRDRPLYVSYDVSTKVFDMAVELLKRAGDHDIQVAGTEIEVAWTCIASLMSLGPNFVRPHLTQLLVLWRNALPKPTSKDSAQSVGRSVDEWMFLLHVREAALSAILHFLLYNYGPLVNLDVARRIASVLSNALSFATTFLEQNLDDGDPALISKRLSLRTREALLRRRAFQCFSALGSDSITESTQASLLDSVASTIAGPDVYLVSSVQASIASSSGGFASIWHSTDGYAHGLTSIDASDYAASDSGLDTSSEKDPLNRDVLEVSIDALLRTPILNAHEHDPLSLCQPGTSVSQEPPPPLTAVVDCSIQLFAQLLPSQDVSSSLRTLTQLVNLVNVFKSDRNAGRKAAIYINATIAILLGLRSAMSVNLRQARETLGNPQVASLLSSFLKHALVDGDSILRVTASECIGRLASLADTSFLTTQAGLLVEQVVNNRDPNARAGCAVAFGAIYSYVGGLAAGPVLKTSVDVLMSLSTDPHPLVHFWALNALARVVNSVSLAYSPFISRTLGMLLKVYLMESHELEGGTALNSNLSGDLPAYPVVCQIIDATINVLGPDIQDSPRPRILILSLVNEFSLEVDEAICVEALKCVQHLLMFAPEYIPIPALVKQFRNYLSSSRRPLKVASINALYQLVQKDALALSKLGGDQVVADLFGMLDDDSSVHGVRNVITSWLQQTVLLNPSAWIDLCQRIMAKTTASQQVANVASSNQQLHDDEGESLNVVANVGKQSNSQSHSTSRWRTQLFALQCLHSICIVVQNSGKKQHWDVHFAIAQGLTTTNLLFSRVPDLIKIAFTASTAYVTEIRLEGLVLLQDIIQTFSTSQDPEYDEALLLEQHQAPITAALTPAFSSESTPEILASAVQTSAVFVGSGVVRDTARMGRILKLLVGALEQSKDSTMFSLGDLSELSPNASSMLRISTLSAWAQLQISSSHHTYLVHVIQPQRHLLAPLWIAALRDYAGIRVNSEFLNEAVSTVDSSYSSLGKEVLLPYYTQAWPVILKAVSSLMNERDTSIITALNGQLHGASAYEGSEETSPVFFIIFGLLFENLTTASYDPQASSLDSHYTTAAALETLKNLLQPEFSGKALTDPTVFDEFISLCYRMAMTESAVIQSNMIEALVVFAVSASSQGQNEASGAIHPAWGHCLKICSYIIRHTLPQPSKLIIQGALLDHVKMIVTAFAAFSAAYHHSHKAACEDIQTVGMCLYAELLRSESVEDVVGPTLPALKALINLPISQGSQQNRHAHLVHDFLSSCLLTVQVMSERSGVAVTIKIKNNLLALTLVLTNSLASVQISDDVVEQTCSILTHQLLEESEVSLTAAHCIRTVLATTSSASILSQKISRGLLPGIIEFLIRLTPEAAESPQAKSQAQLADEIWKSFSLILGFIPEQHCSLFLGLLLPSAALLLHRFTESETILHIQFLSHLKSWAAFSPLAFKTATKKLSQDQRSIIELSLRKAVGVTAGSGQMSANIKPQISLRAF